MEVERQRELVASAIAGNREALEELLLAHCDVLAEHIRPKLMGPLQNLISAEDILQETFSERSSRSVVSSRSPTILSRPG